MLFEVLSRTMTHEAGRPVTVQRVAEAVGLVVAAPSGAPAGRQECDNKRAVGVAYKMNIVKPNQRPPLAGLFAIRCAAAAQAVQDVEVRDFFERLKDLCSRLCDEAPRGFWNTYREQLEGVGAADSGIVNRVLNSALEEMPQSADARRHLESVCQEYQDLMDRLTDGSPSYETPCKPVFNRPRWGLAQPIISVRERHLGINIKEYDRICSWIARQRVYAVLGENRYDLTARRSFDALMANVEGLAQIWHSQSSHPNKHRLA